MQRSSSHQANNSGAIRISNKRPLSFSGLNPLHRLRVHFRHHQWDPLLHPKRRAVIQHHRPLPHRQRPELFADGPTSAEQGNVNAVEAVGGELLDGVAAAFEGEALAGGALGGEHFDGAVGEVTVVEDGEEFLADGAGDADDGDGGAGVLEGHPDAEWGTGVGGGGGGRGNADGGAEHGGFGESGGHFCWGVAAAGGKGFWVLKVSVLLWLFLLV